MSVTSIAALSGSDKQIVDAIAAASRGSKVSFNYLLATARRESGLNNTAKSSTSSASGLYQFVSQTWLSTLKTHGAAHGLGAYANAISRDSSGQLKVADPVLKGEILALRQDPTVSAQMAAALASDNAKSLESRLSRTPSEGEIYAAHVLGAAGAAKLIEGASQNPAVNADQLFPDAAAANRGLFYDRKTGAPVSVAALYARLTGEANAPASDVEMASLPATTFTTAGYETRSPVAFASDALVVLNAIQPRMPLVLIDDKSKDDDKDRAARAQRLTAQS